MHDIGALLHRIECKLDHVIEMEGLILEAIRAGNDTARVQAVIDKMEASKKILETSIANQQ